MQSGASVLVTTTFFVGMDQLELPATPSRGDRFAEEYFLTTDRTRIATLVKPFAHQLGSVETNYLTEGGAKALAFRVGQQEVDPSDISASLDKILIEDICVVKMLQFYLWLAKDNAVHFDRCWIAAQTPSLLVVNNNTWSSRTSCADGTFRYVRFNSDELRFARTAKSSPSNHIIAEHNPTILMSHTSRYQRFNYFIESARNSTDVALKIAEYCTALEALVSTSQQELSHQVSERVASILSGPGDQRISIFKLVKEGYGFRSKAVHGSYFKQKDADRLRECAIELDNVCRMIIYKYLDPNSGLRDAIEGPDEGAADFFLRRTLGGT